MTRPRATRTVAVDTSVAAAISSNVRPAASSPTICATSGPVSLLGPFGPERSRTSPTTPPWETAAVHRHNVATLTPNAEATSTAGAILVAAPAVEVASAFGVSVATLWRWTAAVSQGGVVGLVRERSGPKGPSKLTGPLVAQIVGLEAAGRTLLEIAAATEVSTATVRVALGRVIPHAEQPARQAGLDQDIVAAVTVEHDEDP